MGKKSFLLNQWHLKLKILKIIKTIKRKFTCGQTGIVVHIYDNDKRLIVSNAKVISSNEKSSVVEFFKFDDLKQDAFLIQKSS
jgi:hypothetical protein